MIEHAFAHSLISVKSIDEEQRIVEGVASTPTPDRTGDVMDPAGAKFRLPMPFLWQHEHKKPLGKVLSARVTEAGILIRAQIAQSIPGIPFIDEAWGLMKAGLIGGLSIGWRPLEAPELVKQAGRTVGLRYKSWEWFELSAVTVPMNADTTILQVKSLDAAYRAASGTRSRVPSSPGVSGSRPQGSTMNVSEQLTAEKADLQTKSARLQELMTQDDSDGGLNEAEQSELGTLTDGVKALATKIDRLSALEAAQAGLAKTAAGFEPTRLAVLPTGKTAKIEVPSLEKGTAFTRVVLAVAAGKGSLSDTLAYAKRWDGQTPEVSAFLKAGFHIDGTKAIEGTSVIGSPAWGGELVRANIVVSEFAELLRPATLIGRIPGFRMTPFNTLVQVQTGGSTVGWVGEGGVKGVGELAFELVTLGYNKIAGLVVVTDELVRLSNPAAEATVRRDLVEAIAKYQDQQFLDPAITATSSRPASITNGVASPQATGTTIGDLFSDLNTALATFDTTEIGSDGVVIVMPTAVARGISTLRNTLGQVEQGVEMTAKGGSILGYPVFVSNSVPAGTLVIFDPNEILLADDGRVTLDASNQATLDMAGGSSPNFSLFQRNCTAIRAERWITWKKRRSGAVAVIDTAAYAPS